MDFMVSQTRTAKRTPAARHFGGGIHRSHGSKGPKPKGKSKHLILKWVLGIIGALLALGIGAFAYLYATTEIPQPESIAVAENTTVYYADGTTPIGTFSEQNREIIQKYLAHKTPTTGRSDSIDEAAGRRCTIKSKEELLIEEANALDSLFMSMKIEDISIEIRDNQLVAFDSDGNKWVENEIFDFALNECLTFGADGHLIDGYCVNEELLDQILHYAAQRDVKIERIPL